MDTLALKNVGTLATVTFYRVRNQTGGARGWWEMLSIAPSERNQGRQSKNSLGTLVICTIFHGQFLLYHTTPYQFANKFNLFP